jgi:hypothetical protein
MGKHRSARKIRAVQQLPHSKRKITDKPVQLEVRQFLASISLGQVRLAHIEISRKKRFEGNGDAIKESSKSQITTVIATLLLAFLVVVQFSSLPKMPLDELVATFWAIVSSVH